MKTNFLLIALSLPLFFTLSNCDNEKPEKELLDLHLQLEDRLVVSLEGDDFNEVYLEGLCLQIELYDKTSQLEIGLFSACANSVSKKNASFLIDTQAYITTDLGEVVCQLNIEAIPDGLEKGNYILSSEGLSSKNIIDGSEAYQAALGNVVMSGTLRAINGSEALITADINVNFAQ